VGRAERGTLSHADTQFFAKNAKQLAGQTAHLLGWRPDDFWNATPAELAAILLVLAPQGDAAADGNLLAKLMAQFPDAPSGGQ